MMSARKRVFVPAFFVHPAAIAVFEDAPDVELVWGLSDDERQIGPGAADRYAIRLKAVERALDEQLPRAHAMHAMGLRGHLPVTAAMMDQAPRLEVVFIQAAGTDMIDVGAATERGILVVNAPGGNAPSVAEHAVAMMLSLVHRIADADRFAHTEQRSDFMRLTKNGPRPALMGGKTLGIIGFGFIGRTIAQICRDGFGMDVLAFDPFFDPIEARRLGVTMLLDLAELLPRCDFVSVNTPLTPATRNIVDAEALRLMKPGAYLVNTGRGGAVDTEALVEALRGGTIAGAGLDVTEPEPLPAGHPLFSLENVMLTPHSAGGAPEVLGVMATTAAVLTLDALRGHRPRHLINPAAWERHVERFASL
jgi:D-3-phosphoglycerate dehydrogenase